MIFLQPRSFKAVLVYFLVCFLLACATSQVALCVEDGTHDATVTTDSGSYTVPVEVEDGEVTYVHWPNGGDMHVDGAEIQNGEASGYNSRGESVSVELDDDNEQGDENAE